MAEALGVVASIVALLEASKNVIEYIKNVKDSFAQSVRMLKEISAVAFLLGGLNNRVKEANQVGLALPALDSLEEPLKQTKAILNTIEEKFTRPNGPQKLVSALRWPFKKQEVEDLLDAVQRQIKYFTDALSQDHLAVTLITYHEVDKFRSEWRDAKHKDDEVWRMKEVKEWLSAPDPSIKFNAACKKRQPKTGLWFNQQGYFKEWQETPGSFFWLHGIVGCGKTVLSTTIIEQAEQYCASVADATQGPLYFYFDFQDEARQTPDQLIRSLVDQLLSESSSVPEALSRLHASCGNGNRQPALASLITILHDLLLGPKHTYVVIDALDECKERRELLTMILDISTWELRVHFLFTSRKEKDIEGAFQPIATRTICIGGALTNDDIRTFVSETLKTDGVFKIWSPDLHLKIEETLVKGAAGMFQWVVCQLDELRKCMRKHEIHDTLESLPWGLNETYDRIFAHIDERRWSDVSKILDVMLYSFQPLRISEIAEVLAINTKESRFDADARLVDISNIPALCPGLIKLSASGSRREPEILSFVHFSVKEYLVSNNKATGPAAQIRFADAAHGRIAEMYLIYLIDTLPTCILWKSGIDDESSLPPRENYQLELPLLYHAANHWVPHARQARPGSDRINELALKLLQNPDVCMQWYHLRRSDWKDGRRHSKHMLYSRDRQETYPLYHACREGLTQVVSIMLDEGADVHWLGIDNESTLYTASARGHSSVVELLLRHWCPTKPNMQEELNKAFLVASKHLHVECVKLLAAKGADINANYKDGPETALLRSIRDPICDLSFIELLLELGADPNRRNYRGQDAFSVALSSYLGDLVPPRLKLLLSKSGAPREFPYYHSTPY